MAIKFEGPDEHLMNYPIHIGIYSYNGIGKTTLAGKTGLKTIYLDCTDAGTISLKGVKNLQIVKIHSIKNYLETVQEINLKYANKAELLVPDTLTGLQSLALREVKGRGQFDMNRRKWGQVASRMIECLFETSQFSGDIIYLMQEKNRTTGEGDNAILEIQPSLITSVREFFSSRVDWLGRLYIEDGKRKLDFRMTEEIEAKDRGGLFPKVIVNPNYEGIRNRIHNTLGRRNK